MAAKEATGQTEVVQEATELTIQAPILTEQDRAPITNIASLIKAQNQVSVPKRIISQEQNYCVQKFFLGLVYLTRFHQTMDLHL